MATERKAAAKKAAPKRLAKKAPARTTAEPATTTTPDAAATDGEQPGQPEVEVVNQPTSAGDRGVSTVSTTGDTMQTSQSTGASPETATTTSPDSTPSPEDDPEDAEAQQAIVADADEPKRLSKAQRARRDELGRVSVVTLDQAVTHMQPATGIDKLQKSLGLPETGYPDDTLVSAIQAYRKDHDLGTGAVDVALLQHLGFEVVTV